MERDVQISTELIARRDRRTYHQLYRQYYQALVVYGMSIVDEQQLAEDMVQDMFSALWESPPQFESISKLKSYLYNGVRNRCIDHLRHRKVETSYYNKVKENPPAWAVDADGNETFFTEEVYRNLFLAIEKLPDRQREVFHHYMQGKSNEEIATAMGISIETVKVQKRRGKETLRKNLSLESLALFFFLCS